MKRFLLVLILLAGMTAGFSTVCPTADCSATIKYLNTTSTEIEGLPQTAQTNAAPTTSLSLEKSATGFSLVVLLILCI